MTRTARLHHGRWFEDLEPGLVVRHALTRTVTETDNLLFTALTMNPAPIHLDAEYCRDTEFGVPIVNSIFTAGLVVGISVLETTHGTTVANLALEDVTFPRPVVPGDSIHVETEVLAARPSASRPRNGVVTFEHRGFNQRDELVCRVRRQALMARRPEA